MSRWQQWLADQAEQREAAGLTRRLRVRQLGEPGLDLAGNDYLGLAQHPQVRRAAADAALAWGAGASASRLVTGTLGLHAELETELAAYLRQPSALVLSTGYHANLAVVTALADSGTRIVSDAHVHASLIDAVRLSRAQRTVVAHNDNAAVRAALVDADRAGERSLILVESVYSVLGDAAPLEELAVLAEEHDALMVIDEAHAVGVHGPGLAATLGLAGLPQVIVSATLSKSLGAQGGAILATAAVREQLVNRARPFIFDTGLAPAAAAGALAALRVMREQPELGATVRRRVQELADALDVVEPAGAVLSVPMPSPAIALAAQAKAAEVGLRVGCFRPPSVPDGVSRLRVTASAGIAADDWAQAVATLTEIVGDYR